ncbi:MAG: hypothetical protein ACYC7A_09440 [Thermoanaerobaculia bacterium]
MAEETLVRESLTEEMIRAGEELTKKLDESAWPVTAAFWFYVPDENQWRLVFASPIVAKKGPKAGYDAVAEALSALRRNFTALRYISVVEPQNPLVQLLASAVSIGPGITGVRFSQNTVNGRFIEDAYLYKLTRTAA